MNNQARHLNSQQSDSDRYYSVGAQPLKQQTSSKVVNKMNSFFMKQPQQNIQ